MSKSESINEPLLEQDDNISEDVDAADEQMLNGYDLMRAQYLVKKAKPLVDFSIPQIFQFLDLTHSHDDKDKKDIELNERPSLPSLDKMKAITWARTFDTLKEMTPSDLAKIHDVGEETRTHSEKACDHYPLMRFGVGVNGYFSLLKLVIVGMFFQSLIACFQISVFENSNFHHRGYFDAPV